MGNAILKCFRGERSDDSPPHRPSGVQFVYELQGYCSPPHRPSGDHLVLQSGYYSPPHRPSGHHLVLQSGYCSPPHRPSAVDGYNSLVKDLLAFKLYSQVPAGLSQHVMHNKKTQAKWYRKILTEWINSSPDHPGTPKEASNLIARTFVKQYALERFLQYYNLPLAKLPAKKTSAPTKWPQGVTHEIHTLPVDPKCIGDGDGMTVLVDTANTREIQQAMIDRRKARAVRNYSRMDSLQESDAKYRVVNGPNNEEIFAKEYKIRLRGVDAPEMTMDYGQEAKDALIKLIQNKCLTIQIYGMDKFGRWVGDVYCNGKFIQEALLRKGCAWHHIVYDKRPEFAQWQEEARNAGRGLWANPNAKPPWEYKRENNIGIKKRALKKNKASQFKFTN